MKKTTSQNYSWIWYLIASFVFLTSLSAFILILVGQESNFISILDMLLNLIIALLIFKRKFIGIALISFAMILGLATRQNSPITLVQIIILLLTIPLWINKFSSSKN